MSLLPNTTNANTTTAYFLRANAQLINVSTLNAGNISTGSLVADSITTSTLTGIYLSTIDIHAGQGTISTFSTSQIVIDSQILNATPTELLLNGIPVATQSSLSSIADWSLDPAISTVQMDGYDLNAAGLVSATTIRAGNGLFNNLVAFNSLFVSSNTSTISSLIVSAEVGNISTLNAGTISSGAISSAVAGLSSLTADEIIIPGGQTITLQNAGVSFVSPGSAQLAFNWDISGDLGTHFFYDTNLSSVRVMTKNPGGYTDAVPSRLHAPIIGVSTLEVSSIVGPIVSTFNGEIGTFSTVNASTLNANTISSGAIVTSSINGAPVISGADWSFYPAKGYVNIAGYSLLSTAGVSNLDGDLNLTAGDGDLTLSADTHIYQVAEFVSTSADNGIDILNKAKISFDAVNGLQGEINLSARSGYAGIGGVVNILAEGGVTPAGVAYGGEVNLTATTGSFISLALTSAINLNAAGINSYAGATSPIGSIAGGNFVHGDSIVNITAGVPPIFSDPLCVYVRGTNGILLDSDTYVQGPIRPYSDLVQNPVDLYIEDYSNLITHGYIQLRGVSTQTFKGGDTAILGVNRIQFSTAGGALENVSTLNGLPVAAYENVSSFADLSVSSLVVSSVNGLNITSLENISSFEQASISSLVISSINGLNISSLENISSFEQASISSLVISSINGLNISSLENISSFEQASVSSLVVSSVNGLNITSLENISTFDALAAASITTSTISTAIIYGANDNLFGIGIQGLEIQTAPTGQVWISSPQTNIAGFINSSTIGAFRFQGREGEISSLVVSTLYLSSLVAGSFISLSTQGQAAADTPFAIAYTDTEFAIGGISFSTTAIVIPTTAVYEIGHSIQLDKSGGGVSQCDFWLRNNGVDIPNSASQVTVQGTAGEVLATVSLILSLAANDKVEVVMASSDATMEATFFQSTVTTPYTRPAIPALITNVKALNY